MDGSYHVLTAPDGASRDIAVSDSTALAVHVDRALHLAETLEPKQRALIQPTSAAEFLKLKRSFQGAPSPLVASEPKPVVLAVHGLSGRAAAYKSETGDDSRGQET